MATYDFSEIFVSEANDQLDALNEALLSLEKDSENLEAVDHIFRIAHTLKGSAAMEGFNKLKDLTHEIETTLSEIKEGKISLTTQIVDTLFECLDEIKNFVDSIGEGTANEESLVGLLDKLKSLSGEQRPEKVEEKPKEPEPPSDIFNLSAVELEKLKKTFDKGMKVFKADINFSEEDPMKAVTSFLAYNNLISVSEVIKTSPPINLIEKGEMNQSTFFVIIGVKDKLENVKRAIETVDIEDYDLTELKKEEFFEEEARDTKIFQLKNTTVKVDVQLLNGMLSLIDEIITTRNKLEKLNKMFSTEGNVDEIKKKFDVFTYDYNVLISLLQNMSIHVRMHPIDVVFQKFPRSVRDLSKKLNKEIKLFIEGEKTKVDREILERLGHVILHLVRNAADHGIEPPEERVKKGKPLRGKLILRAYHDEERTLVEIEDDGEGINLEKLKKKIIKKGLSTKKKISTMKKTELYSFLCSPGFSTSEKTTDISGRGVGLDVLKKTVEEFGGDFKISSEVDKGTKITIIIPPRTESLQSPF